MNLEVRNLSRAFNLNGETISILRDLSLHLTTGEVVAIVGGSGSGKSTLLNLLAGFDRPTSGEIKVGEKSTADWNAKNWARFRRAGLGFVFQAYHLIPYLTAAENVALPLRLLGQADADQAAKVILNEIGLGKRQDHLPREMSGGENQRVAIARALIHAPGLVLADEPTGSLDSVTGKVVLELLFSELKKRRQTALVVTHAMDVAARCDRTLTLREGRLWPA